MNFSTFLQKIYFLLSSLQKKLWEIPNLNKIFHHCLIVFNLI